MLPTNYSLINNKVIKLDLALNNAQGLTCNKTPTHKPTKPPLGHIDQLKVFLFDRNTWYQESKL